MAGRMGFWLVVTLSLAGCATPQQAAQILPAETYDGTGGPGTPDAAARAFIAVVGQVEPVAEATCLARTRGVPCRFRIAVDDRPGQRPNAFQTEDRAGNPLIAFNVALIAEARNPDELAFVMGHEAAHHILGHLARQEDSARTGALVLGTLASLNGADAAAIKSAQDAGAELGARTYSKDYELEADALGTEIAFRAGFDPLLGAQFFTRLPDPGNRFLGTHPPNAQRLAIVRRTMDGLR